MRIISGNLKGKKIFSPTNSFIRPTSDKAREMIFNILASIFEKDDVKFYNLKILDCFCGTGALGIESISRGAKQANFIDKSEKSLNLTKKNIINLNIKNFHIERIDLTKQFKKTKKNIDLFFLDPPYEKKILNISIQNLIESNWLKEDFYGVIESSKCESFLVPEGCVKLKEKKIRKSTFYFIKSISFSAK